METEYPAYYTTPIQRAMKEWDKFLHALDTLTVGYEILRDGEYPAALADQIRLQVVIKIYNHKIDRLVAHNIWSQAYADKEIEAQYE